MLDTKTALKLKRQGWRAQKIAKKYRITRQAVYLHYAKQKKQNQLIQRKNRKKRKINYNRSINWRTYNQTLIQRGEILLDLDSLKDRQTELRRMNNGKKGRPYTYPDSLYYFLLNIKCIFKIDYRTIQGISRRLFVLLDLPGTTPDYTTIQRRLKSLKPALQVPVVSGEQEIAGDSSGLKTSNRGEYRMSKYKDGKRKRFVKVHLAVNIKTRQVVSVNVTDDAVSDSSRLRNLVRDSEKFGKVKRALFDKAYDGQENYWFLKTVGIDAGIKPRESLPRLRLAKEIRRLQAVLGECPDDQEIQKKLYRWRQLKQCYDNEKYWIRKHKYGERWKVEGRYSVFKRLFGDFVYSRVSENIQNEVLLKINLMNRFTAMLAPNWS